MQLQHGPAAVQVTFCRHLARTIVAALRVNLDSRQIAANGIFRGGHINTGMNADFQIRRKIDHDVTHARIERGIAELAVHSHELGGDRAGAGFGAHAASDFEAVNAAAAGLCLDRSLATAEANAAATGLDIHQSGDVADFDVASASGGMQIAADLLHSDIAASGLDDGVMFDGLYPHGFAAGRRVEPAANGIDVHPAAAGAYRQVRGDIADGDIAAAGASIHSAANIVERNAAAAGLGLNSSRKMGKLQTAAIGLGSDQVNVTRSHDIELDRPASAVPRPFSAKKGCVTIAPGDDFHGIEFTAGARFREVVDPLANRVGDVGLLRAGHTHAADIGMDFDEMRRRERARDLLHPGVAVAIDLRRALRLGCGQTRQRQHENRKRELFANDCQARVPRFLARCSELSTIRGSGWVKPINTTHPLPPMVLIRSTRNWEGSRALAAILPECTYLCPARPARQTPGARCCRSSPFPAGKWPGCALRDYGRNAARRSAPRAPEHHPGSW